MSWGRGVLVAALVYTGITVVLTYPLIARLTTGVPSDPGDPLLNAWILWWNSQAVPFTPTWWNAPAFFPSTGALALSEHLLGLSFITSPIIWMTGNPQLAYNIAFLLTFVLSGVGGHLLGYTLTGRHDAAFICGLAYAFAPYRMAQFPHIQVLASFWMPVALAGLHRFARDGSRAWLLTFALAAMLQALTMGHYALFFPVLLGLWIAWYLLAAGRFGTATRVAVAFAIAYVPVLVALLQYASIHRQLGLSRHIDEVLTYSADVSALGRGEPNLWLWGSKVWEPEPEGQLFPGVTTIVLIAAALIVSALQRTSAGAGPAAATAAAPRRTWIGRALLVAALLASAVAVALPILGAWHVELFGATLSVRRVSRPISVALVLWLLAVLTSPRFWSLVRSQSALAFYATATIAMWVLAFGPHPTFNGDRVVYWAPYRWLMLLPGFSGIRVPARFGMLAALCLAAAASVAFARLADRVPARRGAVLAAAIATLLVAEGWIHGMPIAGPPAPSVLTRDSAPGAVLELPIAVVDVAAMYRGMTHRHPVANGYSGYTMPAHRTLRSGLESFDPHMLISAASFGIRHVVVHGDAAGNDALNTYVRQTPGVQLVRTAADGQTHYTIDPPPMTGTALGSDDAVPIAWVRAGLYNDDVKRLRDGDFKTNWETGRAQNGGVEEHLVVGFDPAPIAGVRLALGDFPTPYPRAVRIDRSLDCQSWEPVWSGPTADHALSAALLSPTTVPLTIRFASVEARCLMIRQTGTAPREHWAVAELSLLAGTRGQP